MSLIKWSPFSPFFDQQAFENMDKILDEYSGGLPMARGSQSLVPPIDMYETDVAVVIETPMPGVDPSRLDISIDNGILSIKGTSERKTEVEDKNYYRKEMRYGSVFRQIALPTRVVADKTEATFEDGVLKIQIPKAV
ncbi:Hsp20/alpha crystallin family protein, partial [Patescibacteria group bacterium]|nr:Hsp20/alpha crystallin family protein [Patescibacteria group bacterium]